MKSFISPPFNYFTLRSRVKNVIFNASKTIPSSVMIDAIDSCKQLYRQSMTQSVPSKFSDVLPKSKHHVLDLLNNIVHRVQIWNQRDVLVHHFCTDPVPTLDEMLQLTKRYVKSTGNGEFIYIPLRLVLYRLEIDRAFEYVDLLKHTKPKFSGLLFGVGANSGIDRVQWRRTVTLMDQIKRCEELQMINRIVTAFDELVDLNVSNYHYFYSLLNNQDRNALLAQAINNQLLVRGMQLTNTFESEENVYNEYWKSAGKGFDWVEPDQDPVQRWVELHYHC
jgi:hypothetical protein